MLSQPSSPTQDLISGDFGLAEVWDVVVLEQELGRHTEAAHLIFPVHATHDTVKVTQLGMTTCFRRTKRLATTSKRTSGKISRLFRSIGSEASSLFVLLVSLQ